MQTKFKILSFSLLLLSIVTITCSGETPTSTKETTPIKKIKIGTEGAYPPFNYIDANGQLKGFEIDLAKALCKAMEVECEFVAQDWDGIIPALNAGKYDAVIASMSITEERKKRVNFSDKYYNTPARFVARRASGFTISKTDLKDKTIGAQRSTTHANYLEDNYRDIMTVSLYDTQEAANMDLVNGRLDLILADGVILYEWMKTDTGKPFEFIGEPVSDPEWFGQGIGVALRKGENELLQMFNEAIKKVRTDGTYEQINKSYFPFDLYGN